jgi:hypothetical protein
VQETITELLVMFEYQEDFLSKNARYKLKKYVIALKNRGFQFYSRRLHLSFRSKTSSLTEAIITKCISASVKNKNKKILFSL